MRLMKQVCTEKQEKPKNPGGFQRQLETRRREKRELEALLSQKAGRPVVINRPKCETCSLWVQFSGDTGKCRRFPPEQIGREVDTEADYWCGEYRHEERA